MVVRRTRAGQLGAGLALLACDPPVQPRPPGDPPPVRSASPTADAHGPAVALAAGNFHTCARLRDATVRCWGMGRDGQLGDGSRSQRDTPVRAGDLADVVDLAAEGNRTCAVLRSGDVWCWGHGASVEFGDGGPDERHLPVHIPVWRGVRKLALAMDHDCAITHDGLVRCRGGNTRGELGDGSQNPHDVPVVARGLTAADDVGVGFAFSCALQATRVLCWGWAADGRCGDDPPADHPLPTVVPDLPRAHAIAVGFDHACAVLEDSTVRCWGGNVFGQLGDGTADTRRRPTPAVGLADVADIRAAQHQTTAVLSDGTARGWGRDGGDERGLWSACAAPGTRVPAGRRGGVWTTGPAEPYCPTPAPLAALTGVVQVVSSALHACALLRGGQVWCWGSDAYGALGDAASGDRDHPVQVDLELSPAPPSR